MSICLYKLFGDSFRIMPPYRTVATDAVILVNGKILLMRRGHAPCKGMWVLPGGRVEMNESCEACLKREMREEVGLKVKIKKLLGVYSHPKRDRRGNVAIGYLCTAKGKPKPSREAPEVKLFSPTNLPQKIGFDHKLIIRDAIMAMKRGQ